MRLPGWGFGVAGLRPCVPVVPLRLTDGLIRRPGWGLVGLGSAPACSP